MKDFMLIFRNNPQFEENYAQQTPEALQASIEKWSNWLKSIAEQGKLIDGGQPLHPAGKVIQGKSRSLLDGPYVEGKEMVGGYTLIKAADYAEALEMAKACPILDDDGSLEVREIMLIS
jgi:hypothetical protein